jgi:hypothetical protein
MPKAPPTIRVIWETVDDPHAEEAVQRVFVMLLRELKDKHVDNND